MLLLIVNKCLFSIKYLDHMVEVSLDVRLWTEFLIESTINGLWNAPTPLQCKVGTVN